MPKKVDANQRQIVQALRKAGCSVLHLHSLGKGCPDVLVGFRGRNWLIEIKQNLKSPMTPMEKDFHIRWRGQVHVAFRAEDVIELIK